MKVIFLASSTESVRWFFRYYRSVFPEGHGKARRNLDRTVRVIADNPRAGHTMEGTQRREFYIPNTPFSIIYRIAPEHIEILRVWDARANPERRLPPHEGLD